MTQRWPALLGALTCCLWIGCPGPSSMDAGGGADGGAVLDAGREEDAGADTDAGAAEDAGVADAGVPVDSGPTPMDAGALADAGAGQSDAGALDAGAFDAGALGAGALDDAGPIDGGSPADAGEASALDALLAALRVDVTLAMQAQSDDGGWPALVEGGWLFVSTDPTLNHVGGDHDGWQGTAMTIDDGFAWVVLNVADGNRYKLTDLTTWVADPWSRAYMYDEFGLMSMTPPTDAHLERFFNVGDLAHPARTVRIWVPAEAPTHLLYAQDGQNLFNPDAFFGGWQLQTSAPDGMMIVGVDNAGAARMDEYTHVPDDIGSGSLGGGGDAYADFIEDVVRPLVADHYGEPGRLGLMGSSLGGLISFHIADRSPGAYDFVASLSGTMGWGSIGDGVMEQTMIERYAVAGHRAFALYVDSGGGGTCVDSDGDGIEDDDPSAFDNYCENKQLEGVLLDAGYVPGEDLWHWWEPGAPHNEAAWADRVWRPLSHFAAQ